MRHHWPSTDPRQLRIIILGALVLLAAVWSPAAGQSASQEDSLQNPSSPSLQAIPTEPTPSPLSSPTFGLAESHLQKLATKRGRQRKISGGLSLGIGTGMAVIGGILLSEADGTNSFGDALNTYLGQYYLLIGVSGVVIGTVTLAVPSPQEKSYREVLNYGDQLEREQQAEKELYDLARKAKVNRVIGSVVTGTILTALVLSDDSSSDMDLWIPLMAGSLIFNFARKSLEERTLQAYLEEKRNDAGSKLSMDLGAGPTPGGGGVVQLRLRF